VSLKKRWLYFILCILVFSSLSFAQDELLGNAPAAQMDLYNKDNGFELVGTANPQSRGRKPAIAAGQFLRINLTQIIIEGELAEGARVEVGIRQGSTVEQMKSIYMIHIIALLERHELK